MLFRSLVTFSARPSAAILSRAKFVARFSVSTQSSTGSATGASSGSFGHQDTLTKMSVKPVSFEDMNAIEMDKVCLLKRRLFLISFFWLQVAAGGGLLQCPLSLCSARTISIISCV
jgi:hypothetical protein